MFRVHWVPAALDELTAIWMKADTPLRQAITAATHAIDEQLRMDPIGSSESRPEGRRVLLVAPVGVTFRVDVRRRTVLVVRAWVFRRRKA